MRVAILKSNLATLGGLEKYAIHIGKGFSHQGHEVTFITTGPIPAITYPMHGVSLGDPPFLSLRHIQFFDEAAYNWLKEHPQDIIFGLDRNLMQTHYRAGNGVHATYLEQRKLTDSWLKQQTFKINPLHRFILKREKQLFEHPDLKVLFTNSNMVKKDILNRFNVNPNKIHTVYNGVAWQQFSEYFQSWEEKKQDYLKAWSLDPHTQKFLFIGNGYRRKGLPLLLQAIEPLLKEDIELLVVGHDKHLKQFISKASALKNGKKIHFFGHQKNLIPFFQVSDILILPTTYDPFANVTLESLAMGLPVITSTYNGASEILTDENGCIIQNLEDKKEMQSSLLAFCNKRKTITSAQKIRNSIPNFDFSKQLDKLIQISIDYA